MQPADLPSRNPSDAAKALENARWMASLARHLATEAAGAEDLVQETWLAYLMKPPRDPEAAGSWLRRVLWNFAQRSRRSEARRRSREELIARSEACSSEPSDIVERAELLQRISQLVLGLEEPYRSTVLLRYFEDLSPTEIARRQGVPVNTVYTRLRRSIEDLRTRLDAEHGGNRSAWLAVLAPFAVVPLAASAASAAATSTSHSAFGKLAIGGMTMASKKVGLAVLISTCLFLVVGGLLVWISSAPRAAKSGEGVASIAGHEPVASKDAATKQSAAEHPPPAEFSPPARSDVTIVTKPPLLRGRVLDARRSGIADANIVAVPLEAWGAQTAADMRTFDSKGASDLSEELAVAFRRLRIAAAGLPRARSGADGEFRFDTLADGEHRILAWRDGFLPSTKTIVLVVSPETTSADLELVDAQAIRGRVVDEARKPIAGATVRSRPISWRRLSDSARQTELSEMLREARFLAEASETVSGPDGAFVLPTLEPGLHDLEAAKPHGASAGLFDVPAGSTAIELVLPDGMTVTGAVVGPDKKPASGAEVTLRPPVEVRRPAMAVGESNQSTVSVDVVFESEHTARATVDERGRFALTGVSIGRHQLSIQHAGLPTLKKEIDVRKPVDLGVLALEAGGEIAGIVVDPSGGPASDARVWIEDVPTEGVSEFGGRFHAAGVLVETRTRGDGRFSVAGLSDGAYALHVASAPWVERIVSGVRPGRIDVRIELSDGFAIRGRVVDGVTGVALPDARVALKEGLWGLAVPEKSAQSGPDGGFELRGLAHGEERLTLEATHSDYSGEKTSVELQRDGRNDDPVLRLAHAELLSGQIVDAVGQPVAAARVTCSVAGVAACRSDEKGAFVLSLPRSARDFDWFEVTAMHASSGPGHVVVERPAAGAPWPAISLVLGTGGTLKGKVKTPNGEPISSAVVRALRLLEKGRLGSGVPETVYSRDDGAYGFSRLEAGSYKLEAQALGFARTVVGPVEVEVSLREQDIVLEPGRKIGGRVVNQDGQPVRSADVIALESIDSDSSSDFGTTQSRWNRRHLDAGIASAKTDAAGAYELRDLPAGGLTLTARAPGHEPSELVVLGPEEKPEDLVVNALGSLWGKVEDSVDGQPLSPFSVSLERKEQGDNLTRNMIPREYDDPAGNFRFDALPAGRYAVVVLVTNRPVSGQWVDVRPGEEIRLRFPVERGATLVGIVKDADGGAPLPGVLVRANQLGGWWRELVLPSPGAWTDANGSFRIDGLDAGSYQLHTFLAGYARKQKNAQIEAGTDPAPVEIELRRAGKLEGRLKNISKRKTLGASLVLKRLDEPGKGDQSYPINPWREEDFTADGIRPGRYEVQLQEKVAGPKVAADATAFKWEDLVERTLDLGEVEIRAGETTRLDVTVPVPVEPERGK